jgi:uncharacterized protein
VRPGRRCRRTARRRRHRALHRPLPQGSHRRPRRHAAAHAGRAAGYLRELEERRAAILASIDEQGKLTAALRGEVEAADTKQRLEDLYLPYKPKRRTKAQIAREAGLEPLADALLADPDAGPRDRGGALQGLNVERAIADTKAALDGARADPDGAFRRAPNCSASCADISQDTASWCRHGRRGQGGRQEKFRDYFAYSRADLAVPSHRALALFRGAKRVCCAGLATPIRKTEPAQRRRTPASGDRMPRISARPGPCGRRWLVERCAGPGT